MAAMEERFRVRFEVNLLIFWVSYRFGGRGVDNATMYTLIDL